MTVHGAKGLEFPIVILTALNFEPSARVGNVLFDREQRNAEVSLGSAGNRFQTPGYEALAQQEEELGLAEDVRLMYVAATRARDHWLLVPLAFGFWRAQECLRREWRRLRRLHRNPKDPSPRTLQKRGSSGLTRGRNCFESGLDHRP